MLGHGRSRRGRSLVQSLSSLHPWSDALDLEFRDCVRAVIRGIGLARQAEAFDLRAIGDLTDHLREAIVVGCWWLLREIGLAAAIVAQLSFLDAFGDPDDQELGD